MYACERGVGLGCVLAVWCQRVHNHTLRNVSVHTTSRTPHRLIYERPHTDTLHCMVCTQSAYNQCSLPTSICRRTCNRKVCACGGDGGGDDVCCWEDDDDDDVCGDDRDVGEDDVDDDNVCCDVDELHFCFDILFSWLYFLVMNNKHALTHTRTHTHCRPHGTQRAGVVHMEYD